MLQRKMLMSIASVLVLVALIAGATMAWFTDSETVAATFTAGTVDVGINEPTDIKIVNPGDIINFGEPQDAGYYHGFDEDREIPQGGYDRALKISYTGTKAAYVRVLVGAGWVGELANTNLTLEGVEGSHWVLQEDMVDGKYVFLLDGILNGADEDFGVYDLADVENVPFIVTIDGEGTGNEYQGAALDMEFEVQAVQAANVDQLNPPFETVPET
ncbi:MAG: hypothetical protein PWR23_1360 [Peptostreptococcaceae bacterium]|jgi:predicted ribosomally synthesized peptide with SipW-like signal peptide|nr:hypothetical protein [Peptostreptococcaceae bacterium]